MTSSNEPNETTRGAALPLLLGATQAARMLGVSRSEFYQLDATGMLPSPIRWGAKKKKRWPTTRLRRWADANCPRREIWEKRA